MNVSAPPSTPSAAPAPSSGRAKKPEPDLLDHEYDGIREYDNPLPGWWKKAFWASFFFAIGYIFHFHLSGNGVSVKEGYENEMAVVHAEQARLALKETVSEAGLRKLMMDQSSLAKAKTLFAQRCVACHGERGQGVIGPNLTDEYWLHGGGALMDIYKTVSEGVPDKGMPAWKMQLSPIDVRMLAALVGSFHGENLAGKPPQGTLATPSP